MSKNPILIPQPFANNGSKNSIQNTRQQGQDPEDATWSDGFPNVTMQPIESGGLPPKGMDFNGILHALSASIVHQQKGGFFYYDTNYAKNIGGYHAGAILIADDNSKLFISTIDNNTNNPNQNINGWVILAGAGVNADTATKLQTSCKIDGIDFDGSRDIKIIPPGAILPFAMPIPPTGWLVADGSAVSRDKYADLFSAIGTTFGVGDGKTTFNIPDNRGEFIRGWDAGRNVDKNRALGSWQIGTPICHDDTSTMDLYTPVGMCIEVQNFGDEWIGHYPEGYWSVPYGDITPTSWNGFYTMTRPRNIAYLICIKY